MSHPHDIPMLSELATPAPERRKQKTSAAFAPVNAETPRKPELTNREPDLETFRLEHPDLAALIITRENEYEPNGPLEEIEYGAIRTRAEYPREGTRGPESGDAPRPTLPTALEISLGLIPKRAPESVPLRSEIRGQRLGNDGYLVDARGPGVLDHAREIEELWVHGDEIIASHGQTLDDPLRWKITIDAEERSRLLTGHLDSTFRMGRGGPRISQQDLAETAHAIFQAGIQRFPGTTFQPWPSPDRLDPSAPRIDLAYERSR